LIEVTEILFIEVSTCEAYGTMRQTGHKDFREELNIACILSEG